MPSTEGTTAALSVFFRSRFRASHSRRETVAQWQNRAPQERGGDGRSPDLHGEGQDDIVQNPGYATPPPPYMLEPPSPTYAPPPLPQFALEPPTYSPGPSAQHISSAPTTSGMNHTALRPETTSFQIQQDLTSVLERRRPHPRPRPRISIHALSTPLSPLSRLATDNLPLKHSDYPEIPSTTSALPARSKFHRVTRAAVSGDASSRENRVRSERLRRESYTVGAVTLVRWVSEEGGAIY